MILKKELKPFSSSGRHITMPNSWQGNIAYILDEGEIQIYRKLLAEHSQKIAEIHESNED